MKTHRVIVSIGVLTGTLFLSGCMAAMMPAMMLGDGAHKKDGAAHEQSDKPCDCEKPVAVKSDAPATSTAPAAQSEEAAATAPSSTHKH